MARAKQQQKNQSPPSVQWLAYQTAHRKHLFLVHVYFYTTLLEAENQTQITIPLGFFFMGIALSNPFSSFDPKCFISQNCLIALVRLLRQKNNKKNNVYLLMRLSKNRAPREVASDLACTSKCSSIFKGLHDLISLCLTFTHYWWVLSRSIYCISTYRHMT